MFDKKHKDPRAISCETTEIILMIHKESFIISHLSLFFLYPIRRNVLWAEDKNALAAFAESKMS